LQPLGNAQRRSLEALLQYPLGAAGSAHLESRGLLGVATDLALGEVPANPSNPEHRRYAGRLVIPSFSARGTVVDMALRRVVEDPESPKFLFLPGISKRLYGLDDLGGREIHIAEGHPDRMTLKACGLAAVGVAGVNAWKPYHKRLFAGAEQVYFWAQADDKGQSEGLGERIRAAISGVRVIMVEDGEDLNSFFVKRGKQAVLDLLDDDGEAAAEPEGEAEDAGDDDPRWAGSGFDRPPF
jgi:DNA primase